MAHRLLASELQLLPELHGSFSSWAGEVVGEQVIQQQLSSQQKVRLHSNSAQRPRELLASQQSVHLITAVTGSYHAPTCESKSNGAILCVSNSSQQELQVELQRSLLPTFVGRLKAVASLGRRCSGRRRAAPG